jgi:hypothetical protein
VNEKTDGLSKWLPLGIFDGDTDGEVLGLTKGEARDTMHEFPH